MNNELQSKMVAAIGTTLQTGEDWDMTADGHEWRLTVSSGVTVAILATRFDDDGNEVETRRFEVTVREI